MLILPLKCWDFFKDCKPYLDCIYLRQLLVNLIVFSVWAFSECMSLYHYAILGFFIWGFFFLGGGGSRGFYVLPVPPHLPFSSILNPTEPGGGVARL